MKIINIFLLKSMTVFILSFSLYAQVSPIAPTNLTLSVYGTTSIELSWQDNSLTEDSFKIYRDNVLLNTIEANATNFTDTLLAPNTTYYYTVKASNSFGDSCPVKESAATEPNNIYYIAVNGSDDNDGSENSPWATIQKAETTMQAGDLVYLRDGNYSVVPPSQYAPAIKIDQNGSEEGGYITYQNYPGEKPVIIRSDTNRDADTMAGYASYIKIIGLTFYQGIRNVLIFYEGSHHIEIRDNELYEQNAQLANSDRIGWGLAIRGIKDLPPTHHIVIDNNHIHHNHSGVANAGGAYNEALTIVGNVQYFQVTNNHVHDNDFIGIDIIGHQEGCCSVFGMNKYGIVSG